MGKEQLKGLFHQFNERPIAYHKAYSRLTGSVAAGLLLSQLVYWAGTKDYEEFYKTDKELAEETGMGIKELRGAKSKIKKIGAVEVKIKGTPAKTYYKIDIDELIELIVGLEKPGKQECPKEANLDSQKGQTFYTENTQTWFSSENDEGVLEEEEEQMTVEACDEEGNPLPAPPRRHKKNTESHRPVVNKAVARFKEHAQKELGFTPVTGTKELKRINEVLYNEYVTPNELKQMIDDWFLEQRPPHELAQIMLMLSNYQINKWKSQQ